MAKISHFECARCGEKIAPGGPQNVCPKCAGPLWVRYDIREGDARVGGGRDRLRCGAIARCCRMWNPSRSAKVSRRCCRAAKHPNVSIKDEGLNPTGSFKARGLGMAVTMARSYGIKKIAIPSAGNAASALAAYCAAAGIEAHIFMPKDVPMANRIECESYGAKVTYVDGLDQ